MNTKRKIVGLTLASMVVIAALVIALKDFARQVILIPTYYSLWKIKLALASLSQETYLIILVIFGAAVLGQGLIKLLTSGQAAPSYTPSVSLESRYRFWKEQLLHAERGNFQRGLFFIELRRLVLTILAEQEGLSQNEVEEQVAQGKLHLPPEVRALLLARRRSASAEGSAAPAWFGSTFELPPAEQTLQPLSTDEILSHILAFIETRLEVKRDTQP